MPFNSDDFLNRVARWPSSGPTPDLSDTFGAGFELGAQGNTDAVQSELLAQAEEVRREMRESGFSPPEQPQPGTGGEDRQPRPGVAQRAERDDTVTLENELDRFFEEVQKRTKGQDVDFPTTRSELNERVRQQFQETEEEFAELMARSGFMGGASGLAGQMAGAVTDPVNITTMFAGAGAASGIVRTALVEAGLGAGTEALIQPVVSAQRENVGLPTSLNRQIKNIALAGAGAGVLGGGLAAGGRAIGKIGEAARRARAERDLSQNSELDAATKIVDEVRQTEVRDPQTPTQQAQAAFKDAIEDGVRRIQRGETPTPRRLGFPIRDEAIENLGRDLAGNVVLRGRGQTAGDTEAGLRLGELARTQRVQDLIRNSQPERQESAVARQITNERGLVRRLRDVERVRETADEIVELDRKIEEAEAAGNDARGFKSARTKKLRELRRNIRRDAVLRDTLPAGGRELAQKLSERNDEFERTRQVLSRLLGTDDILRTPKGRLRSLNQMERDVRTLVEREALRSEQADVNQGFREAQAGAERSEMFQKQFEENAEQLVEDRRAALEAEDQDQLVPRINEDGSVSDEQITVGQALRDAENEQNVIQQIDDCLGRN